MLYNLIKKHRGKETTVMTDELSKVNNHMKKLRQSQRKGVKGQRIEYIVVPADDNDEKFKQKPHNYNPSGSTKIPRVPRK